MLSLTDYENLDRLVNKNGAQLMTTPANYVATHYLPNWYSLLADLTPETRFYAIIDDLEHELQQLGWTRFFIKDYVKSLKTSIGATIDRPAQITAVITAIQQFRGQIEGGICVRQHENFISETEKRYFVIQGQPFAPVNNTKIPEIIQECAARITSPFFSVDVIDRQDGQQRILEIGDGQVSGLVGWTAARFAEVWSSRS
jgi:hypothetical protein